MHFAAFGDGCPDRLAEGSGGSAVCNSDALCNRTDAGLGAAPYDIIYVNVVGIYGLRGAVKVDYGCIALKVYSEIIEPGAVLPEGICIVTVLGGCIDIAYENGYATLPFGSICSHALDERRPPADIDFFFKHMI